MAIKMKTQTELAEEMANEFAACGSDDITVFAILDVLASTGISLTENSLSSPVQELYALYETI
jgi:hypothetical protein